MERKSSPERCPGSLTLFPSPLSCPHHPPRIHPAGRCREPGGSGDGQWLEGKGWHFPNSSGSWSRKSCSPILLFSMAFLGLRATLPSRPPSAPMACNCRSHLGSFWLLPVTVVQQAHLGKAPCFPRKAHGRNEAQRPRQLLAGGVQFPQPAGGGGWQRRLRELEQRCMPRLWACFTGTFLRGWKHFSEAFLLVIATE